MSKIRTAIAWRTCLVVVAACVVATAGAAAQEGAPPLVDMGERMDPAKIVSFQLPACAQSVDLAAVDPDRLAVWAIDLNAKPSVPQLHVFAFQRPASARAGLAAAADQRATDWGVRLPDTASASPGEWTEVRANDKVTARIRYVESGGVVFLAVVRCVSSLYPRLKDHMATLISGFKVVGAAPKPAFPAGYRTSTVGDCELVTDAKSDVSSRIVKQHAQTWDLMKQFLPGEPVSAEAPRLVVCATNPGYESCTVADRGMYATWMARPRAVVVRASTSRDEQFASAVQRATAVQYMRRYFGGKSPYWIETGLRMYCSIGLSEAGHFELAPKNAIERARMGAATGKWKLADLFAMEELDEAKRTDFDHLLWAWHWYFRHGPDAATFGAAYSTEIRLLRETGDVDAAHKAWDGVDLAKVQSSFDAWLAKWRK